MHAHIGNYSGECHVVFMRDTLPYYCRVLHCGLQPASQREWTWYEQQQENHVHVKHLIASKVDPTVRACSSSDTSLARQWHDQLAWSFSSHECRDPFVLA